MLVSLEFDWRSESLPFFLEGAGNRTSLAGEFLDLMEKMVRGEDDGETIVAEELRVSMAVHSSQRRDM